MNKEIGKLTSHEYKGRVYKILCLGDDNWVAWWIDCGYYISLVQDNKYFKSFEEAEKEAKINIDLLVKFGG